MSPATSVTLSGIDDAKTYAVAVQAVNAAGLSGWTDSPSVPPAQQKKLALTGTLGDLSFTAGQAGGPVVTPTASGGSGTYRYSVSPALPGGLTFDAAKLTISGTPTARAAKATHTYAVTDGADTASLTFTVEVLQTSAPGFAFTASVDDQSWTADTEVDTLTLPAAARSGASTTVGVITYSLSPALPDGLTFDATARTISGTPSETAAAATYTYSATDGTDSAMLSFSIEVLAAEEGASAQSGLSWVTAPPTLLEWTQGVAVNVTLPAATGDPNITYKLSSGCGAKGAQLPPGISWNASTRTFSGTPTKWFATRVACYDAYASNKGAPSVNIHIRVADTSGNHAPYASIKSSGAQLLGQLWSRYGHCYSGSVTYAPSSGHTKHFYDPEDDTLTYTAGSNKLVSTTINSSGYVVATLRHPPVNWYSFHYTATDPDGLYDSISLQVKHFDCTEQFGVNENLASGTKVRTLGGGNAADGSSFSISDGSDGDITSYFEVDSSTGDVTVKSGVTLDYETKTSHKGDFRYTVEGQSVGGKIQGQPERHPRPQRGPADAGAERHQPDHGPRRVVDGADADDGHHHQRLRRAVPRVDHQHVDGAARHHQQHRHQHHHHRPHRRQGVRGAGALADRRRGPRPLVRLVAHPLPGGEHGGQRQRRRQVQHQRHRLLPAAVHPRRHRRLEFQAQHGHGLQDGAVGPDPSQDGQRPGLREQVVVQPHAARRREQPPAEHPRRHLQRPHHRHRRERAAARAERANGCGQLHHAHDEARRVVDGGRR